MLSVDRQIERDVELYRSTVVLMPDWIKKPTTKLTLEAAGDRHCSLQCILSPHLLASLWDNVVLKKFKQTGIDTMKDLSKETPLHGITSFNLQINHCVDN